MGTFKPFFTKTFFPDSDSILQKRKRLTNDLIQPFFQELFTTNTEQHNLLDYLNDLLDYLNTSIVNYISYNLEEQGKVISFRIRLNYNLEIEQIDQIKFLITKKARELEKRRKFSSST